MRGAWFGSRPASVSVPVEAGRTIATASAKPTPVGLCDGSNRCVAGMWMSRSPGAAWELAVHTIVAIGGAWAPMRSGRAA